MRYGRPMHAPEAAVALDALGHPARIAVYRTLVRAGDDGLAIGQLQDRVAGMPRSTLAHHLGKLVDAELVTQRKHGTSVISTANYDRMNEVIAYLTDECCIDADRP